MSSLGDSWINCGILFATKINLWIQLDLWMLILKMPTMKLEFQSCIISTFSYFT